MPGCCCCMPLLHNHLMDSCSYMYVRKNTLLAAKGGCISLTPPKSATAWYILAATFSESLMYRQITCTCMLQKRALLFFLFFLKLKNFFLVYIYILFIFFPPRVYLLILIPQQHLPVCKNHVHRERSAYCMQLTVSSIATTNKNGLSTSGPLGC